MFGFGDCHRCTPSSASATVRICYPRFPSAFTFGRLVVPLLPFGTAIQGFPWPSAAGSPICSHSLRRQSSPTLQILASSLQPPYSSVGLVRSFSVLLQLPRSMASLVFLLAGHGSCNCRSHGYCPLLSPATLLSFHCRSQTRRTQLSARSSTV